MQTANKMPKHTFFTNITPLPENIPRRLAIAMLQNHDEMINLNPLVIENHPIEAPRNAPTDEFLDCVWQEMTDRILYLPGVTGKVTYRACFLDCPTGLQTHIYAPLGVDIRETWSIGGNEPGELPEPREFGVNKPTSGLYLREDGRLRSSSITHAFVLKNLDAAHRSLVERMIKKAERIDEFFMRTCPQMNRFSSNRNEGSHISKSAIIKAARADPRWRYEQPPSYIAPVSKHGSTTSNSAATKLNQHVAELPDACLNKKKFQPR